MMGRINVQGLVGIPGSAPPQPSSHFGRGWSLRVAQDLKAGARGGLGGKIL